MKNIDMNIVYIFYKVFIISEIMVALIELQLIKGAIKGCLEQWYVDIDNTPAGGSPANLGS